MTLLQYIPLMNSVFVVLLLLLILRKEKGFKDFRNRVTGHNSVENDKVSQMIHSEPFALNSYLVLNSDGKILGINSRAVKMFGWKEEELKGCEMGNILTPDSMEKYLEYKTNHLVKEYETVVEVQAKTKEGQILSIDLLIGKWTDDLEWYYTIIIRDISHRKRNEEAVRKAYDELGVIRQLYHEGEKVGNVAFWIMEIKTGKLHPTSSNFSNLFGVKGISDIPVESLIKRIVLEDKKRVAETMGNAIKNKTGYDITYKMNTIDGWVSTFKSIVSAVKDGNGEVSYFIGMAQLLKKEKPKWE